MLARLAIWLLRGFSDYLEDNRSLREQEEEEEEEEEFVEKVRPLRATQP